MFYKNIISIRDFTRDELLYLLQLGHIITDKASNNTLEHSTLLKGCILSNLFFEPSTRTRLSFESAMLRMGGQVSGITDMQSSSVMKGESLSDTIRMASVYSNIIVLRHPIEGAARLASDIATVPVINAGDGANQHPSQTLLDLFTIQQIMGTLDGLRVSIVGDLKYGRTVHSLVHALSHFNTQFVFCAPERLGMPVDSLRELDKSYVQTDNLDVALNADILYMTRIQRERFPDDLEYKKVRELYVLSREHIAGRPVKIMHPLPRVNEISQDIDDTENAVYFAQVENGIILRQALLALLLGRIS